MKRFLLISTLLSLSVIAYAQVSDLTDFNQQRLNRQKTGMLVLGGWAVANIAGGLVLQNNTDGSDKYFHLMNAGWNGVNLAIAGLGYYGAMNSDPSSLDLMGTIQEQYKFQKILLFNAGLDIGYMAGGWYLMERSKNTVNNPERLKGFGRSIILQGGFLFAFDLVNYFIHASHNEALSPLLSSFYFTGSNVGLVLQF
ncbi:MAG: hypothetical protein Sapg2KO_04630 [Saprospiraceae bacterium]